MSRYKKFIKAKVFKKTQEVRIRLPKKKTGDKHGNMLPGDSSNTKLKIIYHAALLYTIAYTFFIRGAI